MTALEQSPSFELQLVAHRSYLLKFARLQLRNETWAEDAVSETLLAALNKPMAFDNRSQLKTWLVGILKHKVIDVFRHNARTVTLETDQDASNNLAEPDGLVFNASGHFAEAPADWGNPEQKLQSSQLFSGTESLYENRCRLRWGVYF